MLASLEWIASLARVDPDPRRVSESLTSRGLTVDSMDHDAVEDDVVLDIDIPANRPDCLGHRGLARELCAALGSALAPLVPEPVAPAIGAPVSDAIDVVIEDDVPTGVYSAGLVRGVRVGPSPSWVVRRLEACGLRSVDNVVDASNLVMLELGHPVHFFDRRKLRGRRIGIARVPSGGAAFRTLDDKEHRLESGDLVIVDAEGPIALAGVMGGAGTEIVSDTSDVLVEAAWFDPVRIRRTARRTGIRTDSSHRFERGVDPYGAEPAQALSAHLLATLAGGEPAPEPLEIRRSPPPPRRLAMRPSRCRALLGYDPGDSAIREAFERVGLESTSPDGTDRLEVRVPTFRVDLQREVDLIEEVARHVGYHAIPSRPPVSGGLPRSGNVHPLEERAREILARHGFSEAFNYAMIGASEDDGFVDDDARPAPPVDNPISAELAVLRRSLLPGLIASADRNLRRGARDVRLFEVGRVFAAADTPGALPAEPLHAGLVWTGAARPRHWSDPLRSVDLWDLAGVVEAIVAALRPGIETVRRRDRTPALHPGLSTEWCTPRGVRVARAGALHPDRRATLDLEATLWLAEIDLDAVRKVPRPEFRYRPVPRVPGASRDLAVVLDRNVPIADVIDVAREVEAPADCLFEVVDRYVGPPLEEGQSSVTLRVMLRPSEATLTDEETEAFREALAERIAGIPGVNLRA